MKILHRMMAAGLLAATPGLALAWGHDGHEAIGAIADKLLTGSRAAAVVGQVLDGMPLRTAAVWADCAKSATSADGQTFAYPPAAALPRACQPFAAPDEVARIERFVAANWRQCGTAHGRERCHHQFHYADIPLQRDRYGDAEVGAGDHDIVHAIDAAVAVLRGHPAPPPFVLHDAREALLLLAHAVGDVHQPLHVLAVYLDDEGGVVDPALPVAAAQPTRGGNDIAVGAGNLHALWDEVPARWHVDGADSARLLLKAADTPPTPGAPEEWARAWAGETIRDGRVPAFGGLAFARRAVSASPAWNVRGLDDAYRQRADDFKFQQLARAGGRLAALLRAIWPDPVAPLASPVVAAPGSGYLPASQLAGIKAWLPPAPAARSAAQRDDLARFRQSRPLIGGPRGLSAALDDVFEPPQVLARFGDALGAELTPTGAPTLMTLLARVEIDASRIVSPVKLKVAEGGRVRPFVAHPRQPSCLTPKDLAGRRAIDIGQFQLDRSGSYPSTHALLGMMVAMILSEAAPERADVLIARGYAFGESRLVCGFHYHSDLVAGRLVAAALYSRLQASDAFRHDMLAVRREVTRALGRDAGAD